MTQELLILSVAAFGASALQSATGVGFGVLAGPVLLVLLNDGAAIQVSIALNLLIAATLAPSLWRNADRQLLGRMLIGLAIGSPLGLLIYLYVSIAWLKILAVMVVIFTLAMVLRGNSLRAAPASATAGKIETTMIGAVAGIMGSSLAMPGPVPASWMLVRRHTKEEIRATILIMFVAAYSFALLLQVFLSDIEFATVRLTGLLVPSTLAGIVLGNYLSSRFSESFFRWLLTTMLAASVVVLIATLA